MKKKTRKRILIIVIIIGIIGGSYAAYMYFMPHRDVQSTKVFAELHSSELVQEYLKDIQTANSKYLAEDGNSKVLVIEGTVSSIDFDQNGLLVMLLKNNDDEAGVSCTFLSNSKKSKEEFKIGDKVKVKGAIRSGAGYDEDLEMYEDVIMEECDIVD